MRRLGDGENGVAEGKVVRVNKRPSRRRSTPIWFGAVRVGGAGAVAIEARIPDRAAPVGTGDDDAFEIELARRLEAAGADLICRSCHSPQSVRAIARLAPVLSVPLLADIGECDPGLAAAAAEAGAHAVWFKPPTDQDDARLAELVAVGREFGCELGLVIGDDSDLRGIKSISFEQALARYAVVQAERMKSLGAKNFIVALRIGDPVLMAATVRAISHASDFPIALSVGAFRGGTRDAPEASSTMAMGLPLLMGVGDLVCLSAGPDPTMDVHVAVSALRSLGLRRRGVSVVADPAFLRQHPEAARIATMLEERVNHVIHTIDVRLAGGPSAGTNGLKASLSDPSPVAQWSEERFKMRISGTVARVRPAGEIVEELAQIVEESAAGIDARDLEALVADFAARPDTFLEVPPETAMLWARVAVTLRHVFRKHSTRVVWGHPDAAALHARITGRRDPWQVVRSSGTSHRVEPGDAARVISIAIGLALADRAAGMVSKVVAVVERSAFEAGAAYEAIRAAGASELDILIVLIDPAGRDDGVPVALSSQISRIVSSQPYFGLREIGSRIARQLPANGYTLFKRIEEFGRGLATGGTLFEEFGLFYVGPVSGRSLGHLIPILHNLRQPRASSPTILHIVGGGFRLADSRTARRAPPASVPANRGHAVAAGLRESLLADGRATVILTGDAAGSDPALRALAMEMPARVHNAGNAVQHGVGLAWGSAAGGQHPFVLMGRRSFWRSVGEHARELVRLRLRICFVVDLMQGHANEPWLDAPPLNLEAVPGFLVLSASDDGELVRMLAFALSVSGQPVLIGYQGGGVLARTIATIEEVVAGRGRIVAQGNDIAILAAGRGVALARSAAEALAEKGISTTIADARFIQPVDTELVRTLIAAHRGLVLLDDPTLAAGLSTSVSEFLTRTLGTNISLGFHIVRVRPGCILEMVAASMSMFAARETR